jgi:hypothetical protein
MSLADHQLEMVKNSNASRQRRLSRPIAGVGVKALADLRA